MKGFRSHHPPSLDFSWRNVRKPAKGKENCVTAAVQIVE